MVDVESARLDVGVERYIKSYLSIDVQSSATASVDPQLGTLISAIADRVNKTETGTIVDLGCGDGVLLKRLLDISVFFERPCWLYLGIDTDEHLNAVQTIARKAGIARRVELVELGKTGKEWPRLSEPKIILCRNVLHELDISETGTLIGGVCANFGANDQFIIQDLVRLPKGERGSACWTPEELTACLRQNGFQSVHHVMQATPSGNLWFNIFCENHSGPARTKDEVHESVQHARLRQWNLWTRLEQDWRKVEERSKLLEALDIDLQLAALTRQLRNEGLLKNTLDDEVAKRVRAVAFTRPVQNAEPLPQTKLPDSNLYFRERGEQLKLLEEFLRSDNPIAVIYGGAGTGKTTLARRLFSTRLYEKAVVMIDGRRTRGFWPFIEELFSQVGLRLDPALLSVLENLNQTTMDVALRKFINTHAGRVIVFYDNFNEVLDSNGDITDILLSKVLELLTKKAGAKLILASRSDRVPRNLQLAAKMLPVAVRVGRYYAEQTVIHVLDDQFDRKSAGLADYPENLLSAIDRHPLIASLAAQILRKKGKQVIFDEAFIAELRNKLRSDLWNRLVDGVSRPAVEAAANLRVPVPVVLLAKLASRESIDRARDAELLHSTSDTRWEQLLGVLGLFRLRELGSTQTGPDSAEQPGEGTAAPVDHVRIAELYRSLYRQDDDPKWIRESYYHQMLSGGENITDFSQGLGLYYFDELVASADYAFVRRRDSRLALQLYEIAMRIGRLRDSAAMRRASCLIRTGARQSGEAAYDELVREYPNSIGIRTSHIDALLSINDFESALVTLKKYGFDQTTSDWVAYQYGRVALGLDRYEEAISVFLPLVSLDDRDSHFYEHLARALQQFGDGRGAIALLRKVEARFASDIGIRSALAANLEGVHLDDDALKILLPLFKEHPDNVRASLALIRIRIRQGQLYEAKDILRRTEKVAPSSFATSLLALRIEVVVADGNAEMGISLAREAGAPDILVTRSLFDAIGSWAEKESNSNFRLGILRQVITFPVPERFNQNAPIQSGLANLAIGAGDRHTFDRAIANLGTTRTDKKTIERLEERWRNANAGLTDHR